MCDVSTDKQRVRYFEIGGRTYYYASGPWVLGGPPSDATPSSADAIGSGNCCTRDRQSPVAQICCQTSTADRQRGLPALASSCSRE